MSNFIILIPPSEGKVKGGEKTPSAYSKDIKFMIASLQSFKGDQRKLLGVKGKALAYAQQTNNEILTSKTLPAVKRYAGVVYKALDFDSFSTKAKWYANNHVKIMSALFGLLSLQELIPNYKLKIDKLNATRFWQPIISKKLEDKFVIDLLPQAHKKAVNYKNGVQVEFIIIKEGKKKPAGHAGKHIKGRFVRWLCENQISNPKDFKKFKEDGFVWTKDCFVKKE